MEVQIGNEKDNAKASKLYEFRTHQIEKVEPIGNLLRNLKCPLPRSGHRIVVYKGSVFAFGGYTPRHPETNDIIVQADNRHLFKELWKFNVASRTWLNLKTTGHMPSELASHAAVVIDNFMLVYGGTGVPFGHSSSNSTHLCNLDTLEWFTLITTGEIPTPLYGQAVAVHNNKMYAIGGTTGYEYSLAVFCLDLHTLEWIRLDISKRQRFQPPPRYRHEIVIFNNQIYVIGGGTAMESFDLNEIPVFSILDNTWDICETTSPDYPESRLCHGCVQMGNDVYLYGGHNNALIFDDIWKIDLKQLTWTRLEATLPIPIHFHSVTLSKEGQVFIFGGVTNTHEEIRTNDVYSMWLKIPSLSQMSWQALTMYIPNIGLLDKHSLFQAGVPMCYLNELEFADSSVKENQICSLS